MQFGPSSPRRLLRNAFGPIQQLLKHRKWIALSRRVVVAARPEKRLQTDSKQEIGCGAMTMDDEKSVYVGGLPYECTQEDLRRAFDLYGAIVDVKVRFLPQFF